MYLDENLIKLHLEVQTKNELFSLLSKEMLEKNLVKKNFLEFLKKREADYPTGMQIMEYGVAIPHTEIECVNRSQIYFVTLKTPILFRNMVDLDEKIEVKFVFLLAMNQSKEHLNVLMNVMKLCQDKSAMEKLIKCDDKMIAKEILSKNGIQ